MSDFFQWKGDWMQWAVLALLGLWLLFQRYRSHAAIKRYPVRSRLVVLGALVVLLVGIAIERNQWSLMLPAAMGGAVVWFVFRERENQSDS